MMSRTAPPKNRRFSMTVTSGLSRARGALAAGVLLAAATVAVAPAQAQQDQAPARKPNILVIMGDDVGWFNIGAYHRGIMSGKTPNLDQLAAQGMLFTDSYAQQSCTAGRASFILGEHPFRTGLLTIGMPGSPQGIPDWAPTIADLLKNQGYTTGQFGKNHLGDRDSQLPTVHFRAARRCLLCSASSALCLRGEDALPGQG